MDRELIRAQMPSLVAAHVPRNTRRIEYQIYDDQPIMSVFGHAVDPSPFEGSVIALTTDALIIKTGRAHFAVVDRHLATMVPLIGTRVHVQPYARRRFDGQRADASQMSELHMHDDQPGLVIRLMAGNPSIKLPVPPARCPELQDLIQQLEALPAPDGFRRIGHLLVDANACDFELVDPTPKNIIRTPPEISFSVHTAKFSGRVAVIYDRGADVYVVELREGGRCVDRHDDVYFDDLGIVLEKLIDDGQWRRIHVDILTGPGKRLLH
ncbi:GTPase [Burkholderia cepacia]|uniref:GTPase n=1 Tax=Burkholderia cepacia TaxID=292 RepID=UPI00158E636D|nr:GTPase [Burkholderia cepacia]